MVAKKILIKKYFKNLKTYINKSPKCKYINSWEKSIRTEGKGVYDLRTET
jgi:hypothetical protein